MPTLIITSLDSLFVIFSINKVTFHSFWKPKCKISYPGLLILALPAQCRGNLFINFNFIIDLSMHQFVVWSLFKSTCSVLILPTTNGKFKDCVQLQMGNLRILFTCRVIITKWHDLQVPNFHSTILNRPMTVRWKSFKCLTILRLLFCM